MGTVSNRPWERERGEGTGWREGRGPEGERGGDRRERGEGEERRNEMRISTHQYSMQRL